MEFQSLDDELSAINAKRAEYQSKIEEYTHKLSDLDAKRERALLLWENPVRGNQYC